MSIEEALDEHQSRRSRGTARVSLLVGPHAATWPAVKGWADRRQRLTANVSTLGPDACLRTFARALRRAGDPRATVLAAIFPHRTIEPSVTPETWDALTPSERIELLAKWPADATTKAIAERILTCSEDAELLQSLEELEAATGLLGCSQGPVLIATASGEDFQVGELACLLEIAERIPTIPVILLADEAGFRFIREAAERGERVAAFVRDGLIPPNGFSVPQRLQEEHLKSLPESTVYRVRVLDQEGHPSPTIEAFLTAATTAPEAEPSVFDSRAEEFLSMLLEGDPRTAGLFVPQGRPGFQMNNSQPARVDFLCPSLRIALEVDGPHHLQPDQFRRDRRKDRELQKAGYLILRFLAEDVILRFEEVRAQIQTAVAWRENCELKSKTATAFRV